MTHTFAILFLQGTYADLVREYGILVTGWGKDKDGPYEKGRFRNLGVKMRGKENIEGERIDPLFEYFGPERDIKKWNSDLEPEIRRRNSGVLTGQRPYAILGTVQVKIKKN